MKQITQLFINFLLCLTITHYYNTSGQSPCGPCIVTPYFCIRSQGVNAARHASGTLNQFHLCPGETIYGTLSVTPSYTRTFNTHHITHCLFSDALVNNVITVSGSRIANRGAQDWLADYFYLPTDFKSTLSFDPVIDNFLVDFNFYLGLDYWYPGLYFYVYAPLVHSRWHLRMKECIIQSGVNAHPAGYFTPALLPRGQMNNSFTEFASGRIISPVNQTITLPIDATTTTETISTVLQPLQQAKISTKRLVRSRLADMRMFFGVDWLCDTYYHFGAGVQVAAPTGNRPEAEFLFEPIVGNGHHWEIGGMINGHYTWYLNETESASASLFADFNLTHLFKAEQKRTFDLKNSAVSRYMLAQKLGNTDTGTPITNNLQGGGQTPSAQFQNEFIPLANLTTFCVNTRSAVQVDIVVMGNFSYKGFSWDFGYNFWTRTCEKLSRCGGIPTPFDNNTTWALKGDSQVIGFTATAEAGADPNRLPANFPVNLSATQDQATIYSGKNFPATGAPAASTFNTGRTNLNIDSPRLATAGPTVATGSQVTLHIDPDSGVSAPINTSINPIFMDILDVNFCPAQSKGISSKVFTHLAYTWQDCCKRWTPYIGIGGEAEFGHNTTCCVINNCPSCAISQWGVWIKGGISFE